MIEGTAALFGYVYGAFGFITWRNHNTGRGSMIADIAGTALCSIFWPVYLTFKYLEKKA